MAQVFISYAREDEQRVQHLVRALEAEGLSVFWDHDIPSGQTWRSYIGKSLSDARCVIVVWSHYSVASDWVIEEADEGRQRGTLIPVLLDSVQPPIGFRSVQAANLINWQFEPTFPPFEQLLRDIRSMVSSSLAPEPPVPITTPEHEHSSWWESKRTRRIFMYVATSLALIIIAGSGYWVLKKPQPHQKSPLSDVQRASDATSGSFNTQLFQQLVTYAYSPEGLSLTKKEASEWAEQRLRDSPTFDLQRFKQLVTYAYSPEGLNLTKKEASEWALHKIKETH